MTPEQAKRLQYLEAMGIDVWLSRSIAPVPEKFLDIETAEIDSDCEIHAPADHTALSAQWETLIDAVRQCRLCPLCSSRTQTVFGSGSKNADWMLIGEAPGQQEDLQGLPFVGSAGLLLTEMLRAIGLGRDEVYIANILKCRPPGNRDPKPEEAAQCRQYLDQQIALIQPKIILAVGRIAAQTLLATTSPLSRLRGKIHTLNDTPLVVVYHPAYLLRNLIDKRKAWEDLQFALRTYQQNNH